MPSNSAPKLRKNRLFPTPDKQGPKDYNHYHNMRTGIGEKKLETYIILPENLSDVNSFRAETLAEQENGRL